MDSLLSNTRAMVESWHCSVGRSDYMRLILGVSAKRKFSEVILNPISGQVTINGNTVKRHEELDAFLCTNRYIRICFDYTGPTDGTGKPLDTLQEVIFENLEEPDESL